MKRYKPELTNTQKPWPHLDVKMVECEDGGYVEYSPMLDAAPEMYAMLENIHKNCRLPLERDLVNLLAKARGEL